MKSLFLISVYLAIPTIDLIENDIPREGGS